MKLSGCFDADAFFYCLYVRREDPVHFCLQGVLESEVNKSELSSPTYKVQSSSENSVLAVLLSQSLVYRLDMIQSR